MFVGGDAFVESEQNPKSFRWKNVAVVVVAVLVNPYKHQTVDKEENFTLNCAILTPYLWSIMAMKC